MMNYIIDSKTQVVHKIICTRKPTTNAQELGDFTYPSEAIIEAKSIGFPKAEGCEYCCTELKKS